MSDDMNAQVSNAHVANAARRGMKRRHLLPEMLVSGAESDWIRCDIYTQSYNMCFIGRCKELTNTFGNILSVVSVTKALLNFPNTFVLFSFFGPQFIWAIKDVIC